jgi:hypothetical protein
VQEIILRKIGAVQPIGVKRIMKTASRFAFSATWEHLAPRPFSGEPKMTDLGTHAPKIQTFFTHTAQQVARSFSFVERVSKLTGVLFLQTMTFGFLDEPEASLSELTETSLGLGVRITTQGLQTRIEKGRSSTAFNTTFRI